MTSDTTELVQALARTLPAEVIETHISWVLLTGKLAYKIKKPVRLPFLDYSTIEQRRHFCDEEVRLNRRLAPGLYLGVSRICGPRAAPGVDGSGETLEYAVRMRQFPKGALFEEQLAAGVLSVETVDRFAYRLAQFHASARRNGRHMQPTPHGQERLMAVLHGCALALGPANTAALATWLSGECARLAPLWQRRLGEGRVRECHGDLHLANVISLGKDVAAFDCIEFDPSLRWIDILEDAAFLFMDFIARARPDLGWRFLNAWLEHTGDYGCVPALRLCVVGRALIRAQVNLLRGPLGDGARRYADVALAWSRAGEAPRLTIMHGLPGSGKTVGAQRLLQQGAICIRSDVERKRLFGLQPLDDSRSLGLNLYTPETTRRTYLRLLSFARTALQAGHSVVLDAAFLRFNERQEALHLARKLGVAFHIASCSAPSQLLRQRIQARRADASEADVRVLEQLQALAEPLRPQELQYVMEPAAQNDPGGG